MVKKRKKKGTNNKAWFTLGSLTTSLKRSSSEKAPKWTSVV